MTVWSHCIHDEGGWARLFGWGVAVKAPWAPRDFVERYGVGYQTRFLGWRFQPLRGDARPLLWARWQMLKLIYRAIPTCTLWTQNPARKEWVFRPWPRWQVPHYMVLFAKDPWFDGALELIDAKAEEVAADVIFGGSTFDAPADDLAGSLAEIIVMDEVIGDGQNDV